MMGRWSQMNLHRRAVTLSLMEFAAVLMGLCSCEVEPQGQQDSEPQQDDAIEPICVEGTTTCTGNDFMRCVDGEYVAEEGCIETCHPANGCDSTMPASELACPENPQAILIVDFRSGWWSGGGGGNFFEIILEKIFNTCPNISIEYLHFEINFLVKCIYKPGQTPNCFVSEESFLESATYEQLLQYFDNENWDDYTQLWILSGSDQDPMDINITSDFFSHFIAETKNSCIPIFLGAGDGFITHGNALGTELGIGNILATDLSSPGFFSVATDIDPEGRYVSTVTSMNSDQHLQDHLLFTDVSQIADVVSLSMHDEHAQRAIGDILLENDAYTIIAHDTYGKPAIGVGEIDTDAPNEPRPIVVDTGLQRFYTVGYDIDTQTYLENIVMYLGSVGCKAIVY